jgi:hypothetical protein
MNGRAATDYARGVQVGFGLSRVVAHLFGARNERGRQLTATLPAPHYFRKPGAYTDAPGLGSAVSNEHASRIDEFLPRSEIDDLYLVRPSYIVADGKVGHCPQLLLHGQYLYHGDNLDILRSSIAHGDGRSDLPRPAV